MGQMKEMRLSLGDQLARVFVEASGIEKQLLAKLEPALQFMGKLPVDSYLIGGSLRDLVNGRPMRDFDIYVHPDFELEMLEATGYDIEKDIVSNDIEYPGQVDWGKCNFDLKIRRIIELQPIPEKQRKKIDFDFSDIVNSEYIPPIQLMVMKEWFKDQEAASRSVDFGICQISYNLVSGLHFTSQFFSDCINQKFTYQPENRSESDHQRSRDRFERLRQTKYHGYTLVGLEASK